MKNKIPKTLLKLAKNLPCPLYITGGFVRNNLAGLPTSDFDICAPLTSEVFIDYAIKNDFNIACEYQNTLTVKITDINNENYEFSSFRTEKYIRGHIPSVTTFTDNIYEDALRRDFKCNSVYYDIKNDSYVDPLDGISDIKNKIISTVMNPDRVFCNDGLRLMRLCRLCGELDFYPDESTLLSAKKFCRQIDYISKERVFTELKLILNADMKYQKLDGQYRALKLLKKIGVLEKIIPELTLGDNMPQRADFHDYDVLEHSFRCVKYSMPTVRLAALLHDVGKPYCFIKNKSFRGHDIIGAELAEKILKRLKASKNEIKQAISLISLHMYDLDSKTKTSKIKLFIVKNYDIYFDLLKLKQADFSACKDNLSTCPTIIKWERIRGQMIENNTPLTLKDLNIKGGDLIMLGFNNINIKLALEKLLIECVIEPKFNQYNLLIERAKELKNE
jgi:tRNA nucleotidyltransferase (CCA-adding enzyme)